MLLEDGLSNIILEGNYFVLGWHMHFEIVQACYSNPNSTQDLSCNGAVQAQSKKPSSAGVDARGYGSEEDPVTFSDAEAVVLRTQEQPGAASKERIREWRADYRRQLPRLTRLEQVRTLWRLASD